jgi:hypothetical protein
MLLSSPSSVRFHRTSYAIIKASVTVWLSFPPSLHPYIGLQIRRWLAGEFSPSIAVTAPQVVRSIRRPKQPVRIPSTSLVSQHPATLIRLQSIHQFSRHASKMGCIRKDLIVLSTAFLHAELWLVYPLKRRVRDISPGGS